MSRLDGLPVEMTTGLLENLAGTEAEIDLDLTLYLMAFDSLSVLPKPDPLALRLLDS